MFSQFCTRIQYSYYSVKAKRRPYTCIRGAFCNDALYKLTFTFTMVSAITSPDRTGAKVLLPVRLGLVPVRAMEASQPFGGQCPRLPLKNETGTGMSENRRTPQDTSGHTTGYRSE